MNNDYHVTGGQYFSILVLKPYFLSNILNTLYRKYQGPKVWKNLEKNLKVSFQRSQLGPF